MYKIFSCNIVLALLAMILGAVRVGAEPHASEASDGHGYHKNLVGVFTGITHAGRRKNGAALGAEYAFELSDGWEIAPQINVDLVDNEDVWVFGVVFAKGF